MAPESNTPNANTPSVNAPIRQNVAVPKPDAGANVVIDSSAGGQLQLGFDPSVATPTRSGNDLSFDVEGGGKVTVKDFFAVGDESLPSLRLPDGTVVASTDFFSGSGLDMTTAAGPGGGAGGAGSGSGDYRDDAGNLIGGIDRFGKLGTDFWGRGSEVPDPWIGRERPGGDFGMNADTDLGGMFGLMAGVYEDARPYQHQHVDGGQQVAGEIHFNFSPTGTTVVTGIHLSGFDPGTKIYIGDPSNGGYELLPDANGVYHFSENQFNPTGGSGNPGVYIIPPTNSDHDMTINARVDLLAQSSGLRETINGSFEIIVDAVADKPGLDSEFAFDPTVYDDSTKVHEDNRTQEIKDGWAKDDLSVHDATLDVRPQDVDLTAKLHVTITFGDFSDNSERHFGLVEIPSSANIFDKNGDPYPGAAGTWNMDPSSFPAGMLKPGSAIETVRIWYDDQGNVVGEGPDAPAGAVESKDFFRFEVDNGYLKDHMDDPTDPGSRATIDVDLDLTGTGTGIIDDVTFKLDAGAQAVDKEQDRELDTSNNVSYTWNTDEGGAKTDLNVDVVDSKLEVRVGWASEGGHDDKHMAHGGAHQADAYEPDVYGDATNDGRAPVNFSINDPSSDETIESIRIDYNAGRGALEYDPADFPAGTVFDASSGSLVITFPAGSDVDAVISKIWFNPTSGSFDYRETSLEYTVVVRNDAGAHTEYKGTTTLVVDAVADKPGITDTSRTFDMYKDEDNDGENDYTAAKPDSPVKFNFTLKFPDDSDGESHYMYVQYNTSDPTLKYDSIVYTNAANQQVTLDLRAYVASGDPADLPAGVTVVDGYFKVNVPDTQDSIDVTLNVHSDKTSGTAHYEINYGASAEVKTDVNDTDQSKDFEYDKDNNYAVTGTGDFIKTFGPGSPNDPVNPGDPGDPGQPDPNEPVVPPMEFDVDPVNCKLNLVINGTFEGNAANHHLLDPTDTTDPRYVDPAGYDGSLRFSLEGAADNEYISDLYLKFDTEGHGQVTFGTHVVTSPLELHFAEDGTCTTPGYTDMTRADLSNGQLKYTPFDNDHSDDDVHFDYAVNIVDPDSGDSLLATNMSQDDARDALDAAGTAARGFTDVTGSGAAGDLTVDAVADLSSKVDTDGTSLVEGPQSGVEHTEVKHDDEKKGYETDTFGSKAEGDDASDVTVHVKTTFADVTDGSESHYILIQHLDGWTLTLTPEQIAAGYEIVATDYTNSASPDASAVYYQIKVPAGVDDVDQEFTLSMPSQSSDFDYSIQTGSLSVEKIHVGEDPDNKEITEKNNEAVRFDSTLDGEADYVNSKLVVKTGWASESNNDAKHWGESSGAYESDGAAGTYAGSTLEDGSHVNLGAPINFELGGTVTGSHEYISSVTLSIDSADAGRGTLMYLDDGGVAHSLSAGTITIDGNTYTVSVDGDKFTLTYNGAAASGPTAITGKLFFQPDAGSVDNHDVTINYEVTVKNESGASVTYKDSGVAVMDAVADKPDMDITPVDYGKNADDQPYTAAKPGAEVTLKFTVTFPDFADGSENHYVYVQNNASLHYDKIILGGVTYDFSAFAASGLAADLPAGVTLIDGYFRFDNTPDNVGEIPVQVVVHGDESLIHTTTFTIDYGASAEANVQDLEYDYANNYAATGTKDFLDHFGPGSPNDPTNDPDNPNKPDPNEPEPPMEFTVDPAWATLKITADIAYEGDNWDKHKGDPNLEGGAAIRFALTADDTTSAKEVVTQIYLEFSQGGDSDLEGIITLNGVELPTDGVTLTFNDNGTCTIADGSGNVITTINATWSDMANGGLKFVPASDSFTDIDVKVDYALTIVDPDSGDMRNFSSKTGLDSHLDAADSTGHSTAPASQGAVVVDAVADKPTGTELDTDYRHTHGAGEEGGAAKSGQTIGLKVEADFKDYEDGSEKHYIVLDRTSFIDKLDGALPAGFSVVSGTALNEFLAAYNSGYLSANYSSTGNYIVIEVSNEYLRDHNGHVEETFQVKLDTTTVDGAKTLSFVAVAIDHSSDSSEYRTDNNYAETKGSTTIDVHALTTKITVGVTTAYENADSDAHKGFVAGDELRAVDGSGNLIHLNELKADSAKITVGGLGNSEVIDTVTFTVSNPDTTEPAGQFLYKDTLIDLPGTAGEANSITTTVGGSTVTCWLDADGSVHVTITNFEPTSGGQSNLYFVPGENFSSHDLKLDYDMTVRDTGSGESQNFSGGNIDIGVDAVAQKAGLEVTADDVHSQYGDQYHSIVPGDIAKVHMDIDLRGDVLDKTESHFLYVKVPNGFSVDHFELTYMGTDGQMHTVTIDGSAMGLQAVAASAEASGGSYFAWNFGSLVPPLADGNVDIDLFVKTSSGAGASADIEVGVRSQEEWYKITESGDWEGRLDNNQANAFEKVTIPFSSCKAPTFTVRGFTVENSNIDAHVSPEGQNPWSQLGAKDGVEDWRVELDFGFGDGNDKLTGFYLELQDACKDLGDLVIYDNNGAEIWRGDSITSLDQLKSIFGVSGDMFSIPGKIVFEPSTDSYSGADPKLDYTIQLQDIASGQPRAISTVPYEDAYDKTHNPAHVDGDLVPANVDHPLTITSDSVAQRPEDLHFDADSGGTVHEAGSRTVTVEATFNDVDGSTTHYILIEAEGGWTLKVGDRIYGPDDLVTFEEGGKTFYKIDVTDQVNTSANQAAGHSGSASVTVEMIAPTGRMYLGKYEMEVRAGSTDKAEGGEITYHNNTAIIKGDGLEGDLVRDPSTGTWYFEQTAPLYEDNRPYQYLSDDMAEDRGALALDPANPAATGAQTVVGGAFEIGQAGGGYVIIETTDLELSGPGVEAIPGGYKITLPASGTVEIGMKLSDSYLATHGDDDTDVSFDKVTFYDSNGQVTHTVAPADTTMVVDAVADRATDVAGHSDHYTGSATDHIGGNDLSYKGTDAVAGTIGAGSDDAVAKFTVEAHFGDTLDGSERHYILVEKTPAWSCSNADGEEYIGGKTYYRIDVTDQAKAGKTSFEVEMTYQGGGANKGDDVFGSDIDDPANKGVSTYDLQVGAMSREHDITDGEFDMQNNTAINLDGSVTLQYSPIDSVGGMGISQSVVEEWGGDNALTAVTLTITGIATDKSDVLADLKINYTASEGQLYLVDGSGNKLATIGDGYNGFTAEQLAKLSSGEYKFSFEPNAHTYKDVNFSWSGTVKDTVSGASETIGGSQKLVIDAVADHVKNYVDGVGADFVKTSYDDDPSHIAGKSGADMSVTVTADFGDNVNITEEHWVVLQQKDLRYEAVKAEIYDANGNLITTLGPDDIVTKFDAAGNPYFAVKVSGTALGQADCIVKFTVNTPESTQDSSVSLKAGTFVIETTKTGADVEPSYDNNWAQDLKDITIDTAVVTATKAGVTVDATTALEDSTTPVAVTFNLLDATDPNETITSVTLKVPTNGNLYVDGVLQTGGATITVSGDDLTKVTFLPKDHLHGSVKIDVTSVTVEDTRSGDTKTINDANITDATITVQAVADVPTNAGATYSEVANTHNVTVTLTA